MAKIHGVAGEWARVKGTVTGLWPLFLGVFVSGLAVGLIALLPFLGVSLLVAALLFVLWSLMRGLRHIERFYKGARGEEKVSEILKSLPDAYHVFNDFAAGRSHVDHVIVGPGGVFSVETKFWHGKITIEEGHILLNGKLPDRDPLAQTLREAAAVKNTLADTGWNGLVTPILVFASDAFDAHRACLRGTAVINSSELKESFATERVVLPPAEIERLVSLMENNS